MALDKTGFAYYPVDSDKYSDIRIKRLKSKFSFQGVVLYDYLLSEIFRVKGCYLEWNEDIAFLIADELGIKEEEVKNIIEFCCELKLFDKQLLIQEKVLTSESIQIRYMEMCKRCKRSKILLPEKIRLFPEESQKIPEESSVSPEECAETPEESS